MATDNTFVLKINILTLYVWKNNSQLFMLFKENKFHGLSKQIFDSYIFHLKIYIRCKKIVANVSLRA